MGLDALVYCDCFEKAHLREPPPPGCTLALASDGSLLCGSDALEVQMAFDRWRYERACTHEDGVLVHHHIGNAALVSSLRSELQRTPELFPLILSKVLYSGIHCGDFIAPANVPWLLPEVAALANVHCGETDMEDFMRGFENQMLELVECALRVGKPIAF
jgi:hypothetical protein